MSILPLVSALGLTGTNALRPVSANLAATTATLTLFGGNSSIVDLSNLGRLFSAIADFQNRLAVFRPGSTDSGIGSNFGNDFGSLAAGTQYFVDSLNALNTSLNELGGAGLTGLPAGSPTARLSAALAEQVGASLDNGDSELTRLADIGIGFGPSPFPGLTGGLRIDLAALRTAFESDADGAFSLLARATEAFREVAAEAVGVPGNASSLFAAQLQLSSLQLSLDLFDDGGRSGLSGQRGLTDLLTLASVGSSDASSRARTLAALNQFSLVSSLLP